MFENACMNDEAVVEAPVASLSIGEQSRGLSSMPTSGTVMAGDTAPRLQPATENSVAIG